MCVLLIISRSSIHTVTIHYVQVLVFGPIFLIIFVKGLSQLFKNNFIILFFSQLPTHCKTKIAAKVEVILTPCLDGRCASHGSCDIHSSNVLLISACSCEAGMFA